MNDLQRVELIEIHDEVMPLMGKLKSQEKKALDQVKELESSDQVDSMRIQSLKALAYDLDQAYEGMFSWMRQYEIEDGDMSPEEVKVYLEEQMIKVQKVNEQIKEVLEKADQEFEN
ncbi:hypothetical protein [Algoriphagus vanfongensis]|uniref:hypothetical protein n=1 Tax=Algoriphagus vanfongensis TaxID=426371 RepID=UPI0012F93E60|nr:hypothetical protein [Algoriphagus vanfongensis]